MENSQQFDGRSWPLCPVVQVKNRLFEQKMYVGVGLFLVFLLMSSRLSNQKIAVWFGGELHKVIRRFAILLSVHVLMFSNGSRLI